MYKFVYYGQIKYCHCHWPCVVQAGPIRSDIYIGLVMFKLARSGQTSTLALWCSSWPNQIWHLHWPCDFKAGPIRSDTYTGLVILKLAPSIYIGLVMFKLAPLGQTCIPSDISIGLVMFSLSLSCWMSHWTSILVLYYTDHSCNTGSISILYQSFL